MKQKVFGRVMVCLIAVMLCVTVLANVPVYASTPPTPIDSEISIIGYKLRAPDGTTIVGQITEGMSLDIELQLKDSRIPTKGITATCNPVGVLNTASFRRAPGYAGHPVYGGDNAPTAPAVNKTGEYTVVFPVQYTGTGNTFAFDMYYKSDVDKNNNEGLTINALEMATVSVTLNQCVERKLEDDSSSSEPVTRGTGFVLKSASYGASQIEAGKKFVLQTSLLATNGSYAVENTSVTLVLPKEITFATGSSVVYVGTVAPNKTLTAEFELFPSAAAEEGSYTITVKVSGMNAKDGTVVEASADITVPVIQPERFEISNAHMPDYLMVGMSDGSGYATIDLVNKGKGSVYNVEAEVIGEGISTEEGKQFVGTIAGGSSNSIDFSLIAETGGQLEGEVVITYENARGEVKTLTHSFSLTAEEMMMPDPNDPGMMFPEEPVEPAGGVPGWVWLLVGLVVVAGGIVVIVLIRKKAKARKAAAEEAELADDDFDDAPPSAMEGNQTAQQNATPPQPPEE